MANDLKKLYELQEKAKTFERIGSEDRALELYLEIHATCNPNTSNLFDRPMILLEKRGRIAEALDLCDKAITLIDEDKMNAVRSHYEEKRERLQRKLSGTKKEKAASGEKRRVNLRWLLPLLPLFLVLGLLFFLFSPKPSVYEGLEVDLSEVNTGSVGDLSDLFGEGEETDYITDRMIRGTRAAALSYREVIDIAIVPEASSVGIGVLFTEGTTAEDAQAILEEMAKTLGGLAAAEFSELRKPTPLTLGELYRHYDLYLLGFNSQEVLAKGSKGRASLSIYWRD